MISMKIGCSDCDDRLLSFFLLVMMALAACGSVAEEAETTAEEPSEPLSQPTISIEATAVPPAISVDETLAMIDSQLANTLQGNIAHSAPSNMQVDETAEVTLLVSPSLTTDELASEITTSDEIRTAAINITPWMLAELISPNPDAFDIRPIHEDAQQPLSTVEPTEWKWLITAEEEGDSRLILVISRLVQVEGRESWRQVEEYRYPIEVSITFGGRLRNLTAGLWDVKWWIGGIIFPILAYFIIRRLDRKGAG
jgi:hypothetical protein